MALNAREELELYRKLESGSLSPREELDIYRQLEGTGEAGVLDRFSEGTRIVIAGGAGAPVDIVNAGLGLIGLDSEEPFGGSASIRRGFGSVGLPTGEEPQGRAGQVGEVVGGATLALLGLVGPFARGAGAVLQGTPRTGGALVRAGEDIAATAIRSPGRFMASEGGSAVAAGLVGYEAAQRFPDTPGARALGEIAGGVTPAAIGAGASAFTHLPWVAQFAVAPATTAIRAGKEAVEAMSKRGGRRRAGARLRRAVEDPDRVTTDRSDILEEAPLTLAQRSGEKGLLSLERSVMESTEQLKGVRAEQFHQVNQAIREAFSVADARHARTYLQQLLDTRLRIAASRADERLAAIGSRATREDLNRLARIEIEKALEAARAQERELYALVDQGAPVGTRSVTERFLRLDDELGEANRGDIAPVARRLLDPERNDFLGVDTSIKEVRALQSRLREDARVARANGRFNRARISDDLADAITEDIAQIEGNEAVSTAVNFSRDLNARFKRGDVGRLLGRDVTGAPTVPAGMTLETMIGGGGPKAREASDALLDAAKWVQRTTGEVDANVMHQHMADFLEDEFRREVVRDGKVDVKAAERFMRSHSELLTRYPEVGDKFLKARSARQVEVQQERLADPSVSRAAVYLKAPPGKEIDRVMASSEPGQTMADLVHLTSTDPSGKAIAGLKQTFMDRLLRRSEIPVMDAGDQPFVSSQRLGRELDNRATQEAMSVLFTEGERQRIAQIRQTAQLLDNARNAPPSDEGVIGDLPGQATSALARIVGAQLGRQVATQTGGGTVQTPGILAGAFQRLLRAGINDPARRLLNDAIQDEALFRTLLMDIRTPRENEIVSRRLHAWMTSVLNELGRSFAETGEHPDQNAVEE